MNVKKYLAPFALLMLTLPLACLAQDTAFTKIDDSIVNESGRRAGGVAWADYDNDGYLDLVVANG